MSDKPRQPMSGLDLVNFAVARKLAETRVTIARAHEQFMACLLVVYQNAYDVAPRLTVDTLPSDVARELAAMIHAFDPGEPAFLAVAEGVADAITERPKRTTPNRGWLPPELQPETLDGG